VQPAPPADIVESLSEELVHAVTAGAPHTIDQELWQAVLAENYSHFTW
jgi:hypothetical protein